MSFSSSAQETQKLPFATWDTKATTLLVGPFYTEEPMALLTIASDARFLDFINTVVQALLVAEQQNITKATAHLLPQTFVFGEGYKDMLRHAVESYAEAYQEYMESYLPREAINHVTHGSSGLLFSYPLGTIEPTSDDYELGPNIKRVLERG